MEILAEHETAFVTKPYVIHLSHFALMQFSPEQHNTIELLLICHCQSRDSFYHKPIALIYYLW
jgi:hypothetical protein